MIERKGFKKVYQGQTSPWDLKFDDSFMRPNHLVLFGYDKDLDLNIEQWYISYRQKEKRDSFSIFMVSIDNVVDLLGGYTHKVKNPNGEIKLPGVEAKTKFVIPPFKRKEIPLAISVQRELIIPSALMDIMYLPPEVNFLQILNSVAFPYGDVSSENEEDESNKIESTCTGRITIPISMFTAKGKSNVEYLITLESLESSLEAQRQYIQDNKNDFNELGRVERARRFLKKYEGLSSQ